MKIHWKQVIVSCFICLTLLVCSCVLVQKRETVPFCSDEISWFFHIEFFEKLFIQRYISSPAWQSYESYDHPQLSKYAFGAFLDMRHTNVFAVRDRLEHIWGRWKFYFDPELSDIAKTEFASYILEMRWVNVAFAILTVAFLYGMTIKFVRNPFIAAAVPYIISFHPLFQDTMLRATSDAAMVCFTCLSVYIMTASWYRKRGWGPFVVGVATGCAVASKLTGFLALSIFVIYELLHWIIRKDTVSLLVSRFFVFMVGFVAVWYLSNPAVYVSPIHNSMKYVTFRIQQSIALEQYFPQSALVSLLPRIHATYCTLFDASCSSYDGRLVPIRWVDIGIFLIGAVGLASMAWKKRKDTDILCTTMVYTVFCVNTAYIPLDHDQYYLFPFICMVIIDCMGVGYIWEKLIDIRSIKKPRHLHDGV